MSNVDIARNYFEAVQQGDLAKLGELIDENVVWHQPGANRFSGDMKGSADPFGMIGQMMEISRGTFAIDRVDEVMGNGDLVAARVHFTASRDGATMNMNGVDVMRIADGKIAEMWLFSGDQDAEDEFWGK
jgi:ketosteroid isomerase-like protein